MERIYHFRYLLTRQRKKNPFNKEALIYDPKREYIIKQD